MRKRIMALVLAVALAASLPCRAAADTPVEFFNNLAETVGVTLDVGSQVWQDKTKAAYLSYLEQEIPYELNTPTDIYVAGLKLEHLTNYDVVYTEDGNLYLNTAMEGTGGAFRGIECNVFNLSSLMLELSKWIRLAVENGPEWPYAGTPGQPGGGDGSTVETYGNTIPLQKRFKGGLGSPTYNGDVVLTVTDAQKDTINNYVNGKYSCLFYITYADTNSTGSTTSTGFIARSNSPITIATTAVNTNNVSTTLTSNSTISYKSFGLSGSSGNTANWVMGTIGSVTPDSTRLLHTRALYVTGGVSIPEIPGATDNNPPVIGGDTNITINWPDVNYTGPTYNYEGDTYSTTSGDIDWSPVTSRLDEMAEQFELFASSFESMRSDMLWYWNDLGDALQVLSNQFTTANSRLNKMIEWLVNIFNKLSSGGGPSTMPNPDTDEGGFWEWLGRLLDRIASALPNALPTDFLNALSQLTGKFPFSVPWDMAAILAVMAESPQTPVFDITITGYDGSSNFVHVDMSPYDTVALLVRRVVLMWFALVLGSKTYETLKGIDWSLFD